MNWKTFLHFTYIETLRARGRWVLPRLLRCLRSKVPSRQVVLRMRLSQLLSYYGYNSLAKRQHFTLATRFGVYIAPCAQIGLGVRFPHPTSIVIGSGLSIGDRCRIYQQVTIGAAPHGSAEPLPRLGNNVVVYPGAKFVGMGRVGNNVVVGANAVVTKEFGDNVILAGAPATVVRHLDEADLSHRGKSQSKSAS